LKIENNILRYYLRNRLSKKSLTLELLPYAVSPLTPSSPPPRLQGAPVPANP